MAKMLSTAAVAANLKAYPFLPLVGVVTRDNVEWVYDAETASAAFDSSFSLRGML